MPWWASCRQLTRELRRPPLVELSAWLMSVLLKRAGSYAPQRLRHAMEMRELALLTFAL
jgi:hypothetical protein